MQGARKAEVAFLTRRRGDAEEDAEKQGRQRQRTRRQRRAGPGGPARTRGSAPQGRKNGEHSGRSLSDISGGSGTADVGHRKYQCDAGRCPGAVAGSAEQRAGGGDGEQDEQYDDRVYGWRGHGGIGVVHGADEWAWTGTADQRAGGSV